MKLTGKLKENVEKSRKQRTGKGTHRKSRDGADR